MATIVKLQAARTRSRRDTEDEGSATILFFTGVRYCRDEDPESELIIDEAVIADSSVNAAETGIVAFN